MNEKPVISEVKLQVHFDDKKFPENILWSATDSSAKEPQQCKAFLLSMWDPHYKETLRIDLWTKDMHMEEMNVFFFQTFLTMADTYMRSNNDQAIADEIRDFAFRFGEKVHVTKRK